MKLFTRLLARFSWRRRDVEMTEEIRLHLEQRVAEFMAEGLSATAAHAAALRKFGGVEQVKERAREQRASAWAESLWRDAKQGARALARAPVFTLAALLTLALGLGANTAMFSLVDTLLLQPAPYPEAGRLVRIYRTAAQSHQLLHSLPDYRDLRDHNQSFVSLTAYQGNAYGMAEPGQPAEHVAGMLATADLFSTLGVQPAIGRAFTAAEQRPGRDRVAVLSDDFWHRKFGRDPAVVGHTLRLDGEPVTIIGVMPESAAYPLFWNRVDVWRPLPQTDDWREVRSTRWLNVIGRLRPGVPLARAQAELNTLGEQLARQYPDANAGTGLRLVPLHESAMDDTGRRVTWLTFGLAGFVLLIACANLSSLQLARATANARQHAVRVALGAPRGALIRQSMVEAMLLALAGGALGLLTAIWLNRVIGAQIDVAGGSLMVALNMRVLAFAFAAAIVAGVVFGAVPAWVVSRTGFNELLKQQARGSTGSRSQHRLRHALLVFEIALTLVLLGGASVFLRGLRAFAHRDLGWHSTGLLVGTITLPDNRYGTPELRRRFHEQLLERLRQLPGVRQVALASAVPITAATNAPQPVYVEGRATVRSQHEPLAHFTVVSPHFFATLGIPLVRGRLIPDDIRPNSPGVAVISESMARTLWPGEDPIGRRIARQNGGPWEEIIGIVRDVDFAADLGAVDTSMQVYESFVRDPWGYLTVALRADSPGAQLEPLRRVVAQLDPDLPVSSLGTVELAVDDAQHYFQLADQVLGGFAALGLLLSAVGLYGVVSGLVARRTSEFGIRLALGARPLDVLWSVLWSGLKLSLVGVVVGIAGAFGVVHVLGLVAPALPAQDPWAIAGVSLLLVAIAAIACWVPAYRATKVDPLIALRCD